MRRLGGVPQTRMHLLGRMHRLDRVHRAINLLRKKREALVIEFFRQARPAADARLAIAERSSAAYGSLLPALALHGEAALRSVAWPLRDPAVEVRASRAGGMPTTEIVKIGAIRRTLGARATAPALTGPAVAQAATEFEELTRLLLESAPREAAIRRLATELARTSRQVNTLERRTAPALREEIGYIGATLEEREREERHRLRRLQQRRAVQPR